MKRVEAGPVNHKIDIETIRGRFESNLGCNPYKEIEVADWLSFSEQKLLAFTSGRVFMTGWESSSLCAGSSATTRTMSGYTCWPANGRRFLMRRYLSAARAMSGTS